MGRDKLRLWSRLFPCTRRDSPKGRGLTLRTLRFAPGIRDCAQSDSGLIRASGEMSFDDIISALIDRKLLFRLEG